MRKALTVLLLTAAALAAQASANTGATASGTARKTTVKPATALKTTSAKAIKTTASTKPAAIKAAPLTIPSDAIANANGSYSWTDKQGKKWTFIKTPFGISKIEANDASAAAPPSESLARAKAFDEGDKVRFELPTPFGISKWEKNKSELNDEERNLVNRQSNGQNAKQE